MSWYDKEAEKKQIEWLHSGDAKQPALRGAATDKPKEDDNGDVDMGGDDPAPQAAMRSAGAPGTSAFGSKETQITPMPATYGLPNTVTKVLPGNFYFSATSGGNFSVLDGGALDFYISMSNPNQPIKSTVGAVADGETGVIGGGFANRPLLSTRQANWSGTVGYFPIKFTQASFKPEWWNYYASIYESYSVLGIEWTLNIQNVGIRGLDDVVVAWAVEASKTDDSTNKMPEGAKFHDISSWPGVNMRLIEGAAKAFDASAPFAVSEFYDGPITETIGGQYRPFQKPHLVQNDQETQTWHKVAQASPLVEEVHLMIMPAAHALQKRIAINCFYTCKFIVQFKDKINKLRYPVLGDTNTTQSIPGDIKQPGTYHA